MRLSRNLALILLLSLSFLNAQKAAGPSQRYFRVICLLHLTGSGKAGDPIVPEYVTQGTEIAKTALAAATPASGMQPMPTFGEQPSMAVMPGGDAKPVEAASRLSSRPGFIAWSMQLTDDGKMAIVHIVAADPTAFAQLLADSRPEIRVFQIGKDSKSKIEAAMRKYRKDFSLDSFEVIAQ